MRYLTLFISFFTLFISPTFSQVDTSHYYDLDIASLFNVEVETASKKAESTFDSPVSTSIITKEEINKSGVTTIEEVFRLVQGMIVREISNGNYDTHIRGLDNLPPGNFSFYSINSISLVMIDGRLVYNHMNGGTLWESLPISLTDIEKIEIVRGPNSALYGPNAAAGVINIITNRKKLENKDIQIISDLKFGSLNTGINNTTVRFQPTSKFNVNFSANVDLRDRGQESYYSYLTGQYVQADSLIDYQGDGSKVTNVNNRWPKQSISKRKYGLNSFGRYTFNEETYLDFYVGLQSSEVQSVLMENTTSPLTPRYSNSFGAQAKLKYKAFTIQLDETLGDNNLMPGWDNVSQFKYNKTNLIVEYEYQFKKLNIRPGIAYMHTISSDNDFVPTSMPGVGILNGTKELSNLAYFIKADYSWRDKLRFVVAVREDHHLLVNKEALSYQGSMIYKLGKNHRLRAVFSKANRAPFMADMYASYQSGNTLFEGNKDIKLMEIQTSEIGYRGKISNSIEIDIEAFRSMSSNYSGLELDRVTPDTGFVFKYINYPLSAVQTGISGTINYKPSESFMVSVFGTVQETKLTDYTKSINPSSIFTTFDTVNIGYTNTPKFYGGFKAQYNLDKFNLFINGYYLGEHEYWYRISEAKLGQKLRVDMKVSYKMFGNSSVYIAGKNILNSNQVEFGFADRIGALYLIGIHLDL